MRAGQKGLRAAGSRARAQPEPIPTDEDIFIMMHKESLEIWVFGTEKNEHFPKFGVETFRVHPYGTLGLTGFQ